MVVLSSVLFGYRMEPPPTPILRDRGRCRHRGRETVPQGSTFYMSESEKLRSKEKVFRGHESRLPPPLSSPYLPLYLLTFQGADSNRILECLSNTLEPVQGREEPRSLRGQTLLLQPGSVMIPRRGPVVRCRCMFE